MTSLLRVLPAAMILASAALISASAPAAALTTKECSAKYSAAKANGTLGGMNWNDFRKAHCAASDAPAAAAPAKPAPTKLAEAKAVFPKAIDPKYANEKPGRARLHTCRDQYHANKANNANGGMKWITKGGGYYSLCNKALKG